MSGDSWVRGRLEKGTDAGSEELRSFDGCEGQDKVHIGVPRFHALCGWGGTSDPTPEPSVYMWAN